MTLVAVTMAACADDVENTLDTSRCIEIKNVTPILKKGMTRVSVPELKDYVGKDEFDNEDRAVFTTIKRTTYAISQFTYKDLEFVCAASTSAEGVTSIGWSRDKNKGSTETTGDAHPDRIYWSDATHEHTFTGFCTPQQGVGGKAFDWKEESGAYYGSIGDPTLHTSADIIDYRSTFDGEGKETLSGNVELRKNDILLTHSTEVKAQDAIAKLYFYHGLAQVRVIVNISEFAAGGGADTLSRVSDMILKDMLTMYKWNKNSVETVKLTSADQSIVDGLYTSAGVTYNQKKDFNLWIPQRNGVGYKSSRTFTFYGMVVPTVYPAIDPGHPENALAFSFKVTYPDPMNPSVTKTHTYNASIGDIRFDSGKCTTISISLNHKNEKMTMGAEYDDWEFVQTPDQGELKKNSTFLASTARTQDSEGNYNVTIIGDPNATVDDATWLYIDGTKNKIVDVYGNDGSKDHPFQISTADQLLSFAYEVKGTGRTNTTYNGLDNADHTLAAGDGFDFKGYHIALDAGITLQATATRTKQEMKSSDDGYSSAPDAISWIGIGAADKPFNGIFLGGFRHINRLYGSPLFINIGPDGIVDHLSMSSTVSILGSGSIAETNEGIICGAYIEGDIVETAATEYSGSIVGRNEGVLIACTHIGNITSNSGTLGALLGYNNGIVVTCYNVGDAKNTAGHSAYAGIGDFTPRSIAYCCYFNADLYTSDDYGNLKEKPQIGHVAFPLTTAEMQSSKFVNQAAKAVTPTDDDTGEITDVRKKDDIFFYHWALKEGLNRAIALLSTVYNAHPDTPDDGYLIFHEVADKGAYLPIGLKKSQVEWLISHYKNQTHQFQFTPGTYPRLQ